MNYLGIDNGISGALVLVSELGQIVCWSPMPIQRTRRGNEVNAQALAEWLMDGSIYYSNTTAVIEEPGGSKSAQAACSMAGSFHAARAVLEVRGFRHHRVTPQQWQKPMLRCKPGDTKPVALSLARQLWPEEKWLASEKCRVPHDGAVDAALIAEWGRRNRV